LWFWRVGIFAGIPQPSHELTTDPTREKGS
jgi:hypothetical protein